MPEGPTWPDEPSDPDTPTGPERPGDPDSPTVPDGPTGPEEPRGPSDPEFPTGPEAPEQPEPPTPEPDGPTEPEDPTEPEQPTEPDAPTHPESPSEPDGPTDPEEPSGPSSPDSPSEPSMPCQPSDYGYSIDEVEIWAHGLTEDVSDIYENDGFTVAVTYAIGRCVHQVPDMEILIDEDFSGTFEEDEITTHSWSHLGWFGGGMQFAGGTARDDGPSPGNGTPTDEIRVEVRWGSENASDSVNVHNLQPAFVSPPIVASGRDDDDQLFYEVTGHWREKSSYEAFTLRVQWADGEETEMLFETPQGGWGSHLMSGSLRRIIEDDVDRPDLFPVLVTIEDDDAGSIETLVESFDVLVNNNDSNENEEQDNLEYGNSDPDVVAYDLGKHKNELMDASDGYFVLSYPAGHLRLWSSDAKTERYQGNLPEESGLPHSEPYLEYVIIPYDGADTVYVEGVYPGHSAMSIGWRFDAELAYEDESPPPGYPHRPFHDWVHGGSVNITSWGIDYDIDSDNDNGRNFPDNSEWEEYLEDNDYAIGKLLCVREEWLTGDGQCLNAPTNAPSRIRLPAGLPLDGPAEVVLETDHRGSSGVVALTTSPPLAPGHEMWQPIGDGQGRLIMKGQPYSLRDLNYDPATGGITAWVTAIDANGSRNTYEEAEGGKTIDRITAKVTGLNGPASGEVEDTVRYMNVRGDSFYEHLNRFDRDGKNPRHSINGEMLRDLVASRLVYGLEDGQDFGLRLLTRELMDRFNWPTDVIDALEKKEEQSGFKMATYWDHIANRFILAFAGTEIDGIKESVPDVYTDLINAWGEATQQYIRAYEVANVLHLNTDLFGGRLIITGHSLGGGLATMAYAATGFKTDTFNAAGLSDKVLDDMLAIGLFDEVRRMQLDANLAVAPQFVERWYMEHDILTYLQTNRGKLVDSLGLDPIKTQQLYRLLHPASGAPRLLQGPFNLVLDQDIDWFDAANILRMAQSHMLDLLDYGALVRTEPFDELGEEADLLWNALGSLPATPEI